MWSSLSEHSGAAARRVCRMFAESRRDRGLIFGLIRSRSSTFIGIRINAAMQVTDVSVIRRTIIPTSGNRKVGGSLPLAQL
jgi:hypothetical protein